MISKAEHLLPPNATLLEQTLANASKSIEDIDVPLRLLWDPYQCPESFLPWLAWSLSVDRWDDQWDTNLKRAIIANSMQVHRQRGTRAAVRDAMRMVLALADASANGETLTGMEGFSAFDSSFQIREWWESTSENLAGREIQSKPLTFSVLLLIGSGVLGGRGILSGSLYRRMRAAIDAVKPLSTRYTLSIGGVRFDAEVAKINSDVRIKQYARFYLTPKVAVKLTANMPISPVIRDFNRISVLLLPKIKLQLHTALATQKSVRSVKQARLSLLPTLQLGFECTSNLGVQTMCIRTIYFTVTMGEKTDRAEPIKH